MPLLVVDTSSLIDMQSYYPFRLFPNAWEFLRVAIERKNLLLTRMVVDEFGRGIESPSLRDWLKKVEETQERLWGEMPSVFGERFSSQAQGLAQKVVSNLYAQNQVKKFRGSNTYFESADFEVVSVALALNAAILTEEKPGLKVPNPNANKLILAQTRVENDPDLRDDFGKANLEGRIAMLKRLNGNQSFNVEIKIPDLAWILELEYLPLKKVWKFLEPNPEHLFSNREGSAKFPPPLFFSPTIPHRRGSSGGIRPWARGSSCGRGERNPPAKIVRFDQNLTIKTC